ncbi:MAG: preprotein translocase subunit SecA [Candidatus Magasanikbacteria bacterium CG10_big_fil_rev_8_21_14_0_10_47_10]|uniref:Protein translocase subunit SecA n=1 Tax=Candidatus Magasanikbacteria bacterium CG10_big_fil_rev_8_21_14_0_10_47_10 TaxID=1974652 RepID=A0A2H0TRU7_9BACT|nr:MAG: preprotein translocase subunit SecA [Candidatus Magasanikbacteria bacterium CG10_big_fil_rev_8_21_14_0_10_47_10]
MKSLKTVYEKVFGSANQQTLKELQPVAEKINELEESYKALSEESLKGKTTIFKERLSNGESLDDILPEAFATVRETARRVMNMRHYDVQLIGGMALHKGMIAEMRTGEGKTLVATLPAYLNALEGKGVHVVTVNDYLAKRDAVWMGQIYDFLGLSVGIIQNQRVSFVYDATAKPNLQEGTELDGERDEKGGFHVEHEYLRPASRQEAYACDITYGTNNEYGFDYLRDNMVQKLEDMVMRRGSEMHYAIIDEIDSILIDEARTPLIISAPAEDAADQYYQFAKLVKVLNENEDYNVDEKLRSATMTEAGIHKIEMALGVENLYAEGGMRMVHHVEQALKAQVLFHKDKEYVIDGQEVVIIDEFTGRKMPGRRYSQGLHQAIEAKERVTIQQESRTLATITFQNLFRMYGKLSGMTGTAQTEEEEFRTIYGLDVLVVPTNRPDARVDQSDRIYKTEKGKFNAVLEQVKMCQGKKQPLLIGTISVEKNEQLSFFLTANGIEHEVLNAKNHEREGEIIAQAGRPGAVTLATNMAGRGVDIKLGGVPFNTENEKTVLESGGLFVLGTERHESRRIDNQLRGRSARQGDPGETQFYVSTNDDLMRIFAGDRLKSVMDRLNVPEDMPIEQKMITRMLENAQKKVESHNYDIRKHLLEYDDILNKQRHVIYKKRRQILDVFDEGEPEEGEPASLRDMMLGMIEQEVEFLVSYHTNEQVIDEEKKTDEWNVQEIIETVNTIFQLSKEDEQTLVSLANKTSQKFDDVKARSAMVDFVMEKARASYERLEQQVKESALAMQQASDDIMTEIERQVLLRAVDTLWVDHLVEMDYLRTGIGLQGYGQRDPLIEYKKQSFHLFNTLQSNIQKEVVYSFYKVGIGLKLAPTIMADDALVLQGAEKTSESQKQAAAGGGAGTAAKPKMSKKERKRAKHIQKGLDQ